MFDRQDSKTKWIKLYERPESEQIPPPSCNHSFPVAKDACEIIECSECGQRFISQYMIHNGTLYWDGPLNIKESNKQIKEWKRQDAARKEKRVNDFTKF